MNQQIDDYFDDQVKLIDSLTQLASQGTYVFRGYSKQDQLMPQIIRDKDYSSLEYDLLSEFERYGIHYFSADSPIDFMSYGQHYGLPTRLLDFTFNPFIALSFALFAKKASRQYKESDDGTYYYIRYCDMRENIHLNSLPIYTGLTFGGYETDSFANRCYRVLTDYTTTLSSPDSKKLSEYIEGLKLCLYIDEDRNIVRRKITEQKLCFIDPNQSNQRLIMQQGLFMLPYTLEASRHKEIIMNNTSLIKIHRKLRGSLLNYLDTLGYNTFRLMPDLANICAAVTRKVKEKNAELNEENKKNQQISA